MKSCFRFLAALALAATFSVAPAQQPTATAPKAAKPNASAATEKNDPSGRFRQMHESFLARGKQGPIGVLFLGDSITQGWTKAPHVWEHYYSKWQPANFGIGGDQTQHVLWRITEGKEIEKVDPKVIVLMIGTNNVGGHTAEQIAAGVTAIVKELGQQKPKAKILLLGVFPRSGKKIDAEATEAKADELQPKIKAINDIISKLDDGKTVHYLDIGKVFLDGDGNMPKKVMPDYLHLSSEGYAKWAAAIKEPVEKLMK